MRLTKLLRTLLVLALAGWCVEAAYLAQRNAAEELRIRSENAQRRNRLQLDYEQKMRDLQNEYEKKKYLAAGETVFNRIFNTPDQTVVRLIERVAEEVFPDNWRCDVKVEEFTHFILLVYLPHDMQHPALDQIASYLGPIVKYTGGCVSDVAVFDRTHRSYLFFDSAILRQMKNKQGISRESMGRAKERGASFTRFNSTVIECEKEGGHLFLPIEVIGVDGSATCDALFDTGASTTMLSERVISKTGYTNLGSAPQRRFSTANGWMSCPIVSRELDVGGFRRKTEVAVNRKDEQSILGMNFFEGMDYVVDFQDSAIYVWEK